jgi:hypothetical protein
MPGPFLKKEKKRGNSKTGPGANLDNTRRIVDGREKTRTW